MTDLTLELHSPMTEEEWDIITDVDLDHTPSVIFHTKHGKDVEYVKVKHGHWIGIDDFPHETWECDACGYIVEGQCDMDEFKYCPNCGARMDERG